jgi:hypothetical protein
MPETKTKTDVAVEITKNQLINILRGQKGSTFIQLFSTTEVKMNKGGRECSNYLYGNVVKDSESNGIIDFEYENSVNNALSRNGKNADCEIQDRVWGKHMIIDWVFDMETLEFKPVYSRIIIEHEKDNEKRYYLQISIQSAKRPTYRYKDTGAELSEKDIEVMKSYMPTRKTELVVLRDYRVDNVKRIHINKAQYVLNN